MSEFDSHKKSRYGEYEARLEVSIGQPLAVMNDDYGDIVVQSGMVEDMDVEQGTITLANINNETRTAVISIPSHDTMLLGYEEIRSYLLMLMNKYETKGKVQSAIAAITLQERFADRLGTPSDELCEEMARRLLHEPYDGQDFLPACVFDAPNAFRYLVLSEIARRISSAQTLHDITKDPLVMDILATCVENEGGTELAAAHRLIEEYGNNPA